LIHHHHHNNLEIDKILGITSLSECNAETVIIKIPKQLDYLEMILAMLTHASTTKNGPKRLILSGMQKYLSNNTYLLIDKYLTGMSVLPGVKKAKCIIAHTKSSTETELKHKPFKITDFIFSVNLPNFNLTLNNLPNVFSRQQLDQGTRFFIENMPIIKPNSTLLDLACGNGALSLFALNNDESLTVHACDNSALALASFKLSINDEMIKKVHFEHLNCLFNTSITNTSLDVAFCNPPFHQGHNISKHIAHTMFMQVKSLLKKQAKLYVIGNLHLNYDVELKKYFSDVSVYIKNNKFCIYEAFNS
jgi:16S rRNA G1207 methylase RsmC